MFTNINKQIKALLLLENQKNKLSKINIITTIMWMCVLFFLLLFSALIFNFDVFVLFVYVLSSFQRSDWHRTKEWESEKNSQKESSSSYNGSTRCAILLWMCIANCVGADSRCNTLIHSSIVILSCWSTCFTISSLYHKSSCLK